MLQDLLTFGITKQDLQPKLDDMNEIVTATQKRLDLRIHVLKNLFKKTMRSENIPLTRWGEYWDFYDFVFNGSINQKLAEQIEERNRIANAISLLDIDSKDLVSIQLAKEYPVDKLLKTKTLGSKKWARCPFHEDKHPSLMIDSENYLHCFSCGFHGDTIELVRKLNGLSFWDAVRRLS